MEEIRIYVEGGGDSSYGRASIRQAFGVFLRSLRDEARNRRIGWKVIACGSRNSAFDDFRTALLSHPGSFNTLLVDAETSVVAEPSQHLAQRDSWEIQASEEHYQLMVQTMEAWLVADRSALKRYYGEGFLDSAIPRNPNVEEINKSTLEFAICSATRNTQKGEYQKIRHGADLLKLIDPAIVCRKAKHCDHLFRTLAGLLQGASPQ